MVAFNVSSYNPKTFTSLPALVEAKTALDKNDGISSIRALGSIFRKYNLQHKFGLILLHRHFDQENNELTVEVVSDTKTISMPWTFTDENSDCDVVLKPCPSESACLAEEGMNEDGRVVRPHSWKILEGNILSPYEFFVTNQHEDEDVQPEEAFVSELYGALKSFHLHEILGLHFLHRGEIAFKMAVETTHPNYKRVNLMNLKKENEPVDDDHINVIWGFWEDDISYICRLEY